MPELVPVFVRLVEFCLARGVRSIKDLPGCYECQVDAHWWFAVNGHQTPTATSKGGPPLPPFSAAIEFNGWPAGLVDPFGGVIAAGELANEQTFLAALDAAAVEAG